MGNTERIRAVARRGPAPGVGTRLSSWVVRHERVTDGLIKLKEITLCPASGNGHAPRHGRTADHRAGGGGPSRAGSARGLPDRRAGRDCHRWRPYQGKSRTSPRMRSTGCWMPATWSLWPDSKGGRPRADYHPGPRGSDLTAIALAAALKGRSLPDFTWTSRVSTPPIPGSFRRRGSFPRSFHDELLELAGAGARSCSSARSSSPKFQCHL